MGCALIYSFCMKQGIHVTWGWSQSCQAWRLPLIQELVRRFQPYFAIVRGCQVGLRDKHGDLVSKEWKLMTTNCWPNEWASPANAVPRWNMRGVKGVWLKPPRITPQTLVGGFVKPYFRVAAGTWSLGNWMWPMFFMSNSVRGCCANVNMVRNMRLTSNVVCALWTTKNLLGEMFVVTRNHKSLIHALTNMTWIKVPSVSASIPTRVHVPW